MRNPDYCCDPVWQTGRERALGSTLHNLLGRPLWAFPLSPPAPIFCPLSGFHQDSGGGSYLKARASSLFHPRRLRPHSVASLSAWRPAESAVRCGNSAWDVFSLTSANHLVATTQMGSGGGKASLPPWLVVQEGQWTQRCSPGRLFLLAALRTALGQCVCVVFFSLGCIEAQNDYFRCTRVYGRISVTNPVYILFICLFIWAISVLLFQGKNRTCGSIQQ